MRLLDLFCGAGGAAMGYRQAGFAEIVGVDIKPQPRYPFEFVLADALEYLTKHGREFDVIHASPPCQKYTGMRNITMARFGKAPEYPDLIASVRQALIKSGKIYVIENVQNSPLRTQFILCGASLGLRNVARHRHFECSHLLPSPPRCSHRQERYTIGVYGSKPDGRRVSRRKYRLCRIAKSLGEASNLLDIHWMSWNEIRESVPPAYTEWIGKQILLLSSRS